MDILVLVFAATATALATGLGAIPVFLLGSRAARLRPLLLGVTVGLMTVAALVGLLRPALQEGGLGAVLVGLLVGVLFLLVARSVVDRPRFHAGPLEGAGIRLSVLVFAVLLVHSLPEGFAIGTAYASDRAGLSLFVILAIGLQNIPEGTSVAIPMEAAGFRWSYQFWAAVLTSVPQPVGAVAAFLLVEHVTALLPFSFAFAAGAMLALVSVELVPPAFARGSRRRAAFGALAGGALMILLAVVFRI
jgi:zinc transporter, ZIP family